MRQKNTFHPKRGFSKKKFGKKGFKKRAKRIKYYKTSSRGGGRE